MTLLDNQGHGYNLGDVNHDNAVDINDVTAIISHVLGSVSEGYYCPICANVDGNNVVDINDVTALISYVLTGAWAE